MSIKCFDISLHVLLSHSLEPRLTLILVVKIFGVVFAVVVVVVAAVFVVIIIAVVVVLVNDWRAEQMEQC